MDKRFLYMTQSPTHFRYGGIECDDSDILYLTWKSEAEGSIFLPNSTWTEGRNALLRAAKALPNKYLYYIFMDDDISITDQDGGAIPHPYRQFEEFLLKCQPAVGYCSYDWQHRSPGMYNCGYNFDACFNAFHIEAIDNLLPYYGRLDKFSWFYSQSFVIMLCGVLYNNYRYQLNSLKVSNTQHRAYPQEFVFDRPRSLFLETIKGRIPSPIPSNILQVEPINFGTAIAKDICYSDVRLSDYFNLEHPFFLDRETQS